MRRLTAILTLLVLGASVLVGCDRAVAGTRCRAGSPPHRDANYVLFCTNGRWKRTLTIQQAADFIVGNLPGSITAEAASATAQAGGGPAPALKFVAKKRNGNPLASAKVTLAAPTSGASLQATSVTQETDANGAVLFAFSAANGTVGSYQVTANIDGTELSASMTITNVAGTATNIAVVSGANQTATNNQTYTNPIVVMVTDSYGNPVAGKSVFFTSLNSFVFGSPSAVTGADGLASSTITVPNSASAGSQLMQAFMNAGSPSVNFNETVI